MFTSPPGLGSRPRPVFASYCVVGSAAGKKGALPRVSCASLRPLPRPYKGYGSTVQADRLSAQRLKFSRRGSFADLVALAERAGQSEALPALALAGVRNIAELTANTDRLVAAGISPLTLEALLAAPPPVDGVSDVAVVTAGPSRPDLPVRRDAARASLAAAVEAVRPANVKRAVTELRDNMLAKSTRGPYESRLRTWNRLAFEGKVPAWPITTRTLEVIGAAFSTGAPRSTSWRPSVTRSMTSAWRWTRCFDGSRTGSSRPSSGGSRAPAKEAFPLPALAPLVCFADRAEFDPARAAHSADVFVIAVWFMLREIEVAAARVGDMVVSPGLVVLDLPLHNTATREDAEPSVATVRLWGGYAPALPGARGYASLGALRGGRPAGLCGTAVPGQGRRHSVQKGVGVLAPRGAGDRRPGDHVPGRQWDRTAGVRHGRHSVARQVVVQGH